MILQTREEFDAIVVGSGIAGGWAAKELTERGLRTLVLERGGAYEHGTGYVTEHKAPWEFPLRDRRLPPEVAGGRHPVQSRTGQFRESTRHVYLDDARHPYVEERPFTWIQGGRVGGRSTFWGRQVYRWSDLDFEANLRDGHGVDWPIRYADLAPWYAYVERFIGVSGQREGLPQLPDGEFQPPMAMNAGEKVLKAAVERAFPERRVTIGRTAVLTAPIGDRAPCHYCGPCARGCSTGSYFSSQASTLPAARRTGRLTLRSDALAHSVIHDAATNRAAGVRYVDLATGELREVYARVLFLAASTLGTTRLLLNSTSARFPNGLANASGELGHNLMDHHFQVGARAELEGHLDRYYQGNRPNGVYVPRFRNLGGPDSDRLGFVRGYGYQGGASRRDWTRGSAEAGVGVALKRRLQDPGPWTMNLGSWGEHLPRHENHALLSDRTDEWGIPVLRVSCGYGENERAMRKDMRAQAVAMLEAAGCTNVVGRDALTDDGYGAEPGLCIHEMGTARMGRDPKTSVLNAYNQAHDVPNLFVTDGACMASSSCVNPSITYMALTARAADHAVERLKRREL